ncbi:MULTISPECIES: hypothetical protein [unclassified Apibacter]|uniref:hypothetical protein n=1 Tax=unclassified Apibacter TaxID=2630820 RepID=UPI001320CB88|nr:MULTISPECIES: hypothetical protein [unclassified Apibacter]MCX8676214.1 hypothetical protein [Apibacter sp. B3919]MXO25242.1 hypothetical protein [Apibacter sp. B3924]MXO26636.1 hypothetical protein [Apibacter sp. B3813]MXO29365.1 hypothetical protein [Apibacter sp. B3913]MXO30914.1 hypothetical protein [Apibacter sp. B3912]
MNKTPIILLSFICAFAHSQTIEESSYTEKNKIMESLSFTLPICNKDVLVNTWKNFIKKQGGKVKGGIVNKVYGSDIKFSPNGESWLGNFAYEYNDDKSMTIFTSFHNLSNTFINSNTTEKELAIPILEDFKLDIQKSCAIDDLTNAKSFTIKLTKEKVRNSDRILYLEKIIRDDYNKIDLKANSKISDKEQDNLTKIKERIILNEAELQTLKNRNKDIDQELNSQTLVIQGFQNKLDTLEGKVYTEGQSENNISTESEPNTNYNNSATISTDNNENLNTTDQEKDYHSSDYFDNH